MPALTLGMLVLGVAMALNAPASMGLIVQLVDREELQAVNALLGTSRNGAMAGGAALGGVLVAALGAGPTLMLDAFSFGVSALLVMSLRPRLQAQPEKASIFQGLQLGFREFASHTWLWAIVLQFSLLVAVHESVFGLLGPAVTREALGGAADWGFIAASFGLGTLAGGILSLKVRPRHPMRFATFCTLTFSGLPLVLSVPLATSAVAATAFAVGVAGQLFAVLWYTTLQKKIPAHMLSRVSAYDHLGSIALAPLGIVVAGFVYDAIGHRSTLLIAALTGLLPTLAVFCVRDVRQMTSSE